MSAFPDEPDHCQRRVSAFTLCGRKGARRRRRARRRLRVRDYHGIGGALRGARPDWIVNCTGPGRSRSLFGDRLLAKMLADGTVTPEPLGLGLRVGGDLAAIDAAGKPVAGLWVVGPLAKGSRFEATAVPELRVMAQTLAANLAIGSNARSSRSVCGMDASEREAGAIR